MVIRIDLAADNQDIPVEYLAPVSASGLRAENRRVVLVYEEIGDRQTRRTEEHSEHSSVRASGGNPDGLH